MMAKWARPETDRSRPPPEPDLAGSEELQLVSVSSGMTRATARILAPMKTALFALGALGLAALGIAAYSLGVLARGAPALHGTELEQPVAVDDVALTAPGGRQVELAEYSGKHLLVFFGYTNCPDVCPLTMARLASIYRSLDEQEQEKVQVLMVTVDPERDTPEVMSEYARRFHPDFNGLSGTPPLLATAAERFYIGHREHGSGEFSHSSQVLLVDPSSRFWRVYNDESQQHLEADLRSLLAGSANTRNADPALGAVAFPVGQGAG